MAFEVGIIPRQHSPAFESWEREDLRREFAEVYLNVMRRVEKVRDAYSVVIHTSPNTAAGRFGERGPQVDDYFHWHVEILPRTYSQYKREDEFYTVPVVPEEAAAIMKGEG